MTGALQAARHAAKETAVQSAPTTSGQATASGPVSTVRRQSEMVPRQPTGASELQNKSHVVQGCPGGTPVADVAAWTSRASTRVRVAPVVALDPDVVTTEPPSR